MRLFSPANKDGIHGHNALSWALEWLGSKFYIGTIPIRPTTPTITTVTTTDENWTALATGLTNVLRWRVSELIGSDFYYAYVAAPGNNFCVGFGWISYDTAITDIYIKRASTADITLKLEIWRV